MANEGTYDGPYTPVVELSPEEDKRPCCHALLIQPHLPGCDGKIRRRGARATRN